MKPIEERLKAVAEKLVEKHKPADGKKLTTEQRLTRIEEVLGIQ